MKNHVMPPAEFIAPPNFRAQKARDGDVHNFHYTPYLPIIRRVYILKLLFVGRKAMEINMTKTAVSKEKNENSPKTTRTKKTESAKPATAKAVAKTPEEYLTERVAVHLIKDNNDYQDDVTVTYNGTNYRIARGVTVMVPRAVKLVIEQSERQKLAAGNYAKNLAKIFEEKTERVILGAKVEQGLPTK